MSLRHLFRSASADVTNAPVLERRRRRHLRTCPRTVTQTSPTHLSEDTDADAVDGEELHGAVGRRRDDERAGGVRDVVDANDRHLMCVP